MKKPLVFTCANPPMTLVFEARGYDGAKPFSSGARGYYAGGKAVVVDQDGNAVVYQTSCSLVEVGSKPKG